MISAVRREDIVGALRRGTVPSSGLDALAVGIETFALTLSAVLRTYRRALAAGDGRLADGLISWLAGQPNVAASVKRAAWAARSAYRRACS